MDRTERFFAGITLVSALDFPASMVCLMFLAGGAAGN
jgi:hypothetical protein